MNWIPRPRTFSPMREMRSHLHIFTGTRDRYDFRWEVASLVSLNVANSCSRGDWELK